MANNAGLVDSNRASRAPVQMEFRFIIIIITKRMNGGESPSEPEAARLWGRHGGL